MDIRSFLESFVERDVRFPVIGVLAMPHHGHARATLDMDVFIEPTPENAARAGKALSATGFDVTDLPTDDLLKYKVLIRDYFRWTSIRSSRARTSPTSSHLAG